MLLFACWNERKETELLCIGILCSTSRDDGIGSFFFSAGGLIGLIVHMHNYRNNSTGFEGQVSIAVGFRRVPFNSGGFLFVLLLLIV